MTDNVIYGIDFGGKKAEEQQNITETLRAMGRSDRTNPDTVDIINRMFGHVPPEKDPA